MNHEQESARKCTIPSFGILDCKFRYFWSGDIFYNLYYNTRLYLAATYMAGTGAAALMTAGSPAAMLTAGSQAALMAAGSHPALMTAGSGGATFITSQGGPSGMCHFSNSLS